MNPSPGDPNTFSSGTATSWNVTILVSEARCPKSSLSEVPLLWLATVGSREGGKERHTHVYLLLSQDDTLSVRVHDKSSHTPARGSFGVRNREHELRENWLECVMRVSMPSIVTHKPVSMPSICSKLHTQSVRQVDANEVCRHTSYKTRIKIAPQNH